ncbi:CUE domain-containing protein 1-like [Alosa sapidissima]|uniref:CUE domain-containing protein 1-like n=1 Tax=Alosa sapidissima TaxID=34773 RepID=UPI001C091FC7|nr:CUE domain-containing protein 1-like [Alosa sapidissima]
MTSLFHRTISRSHGASSPRTGSGNSNSSSSAPSRPQRVVHRLEFNQAMGDFRTMFPGVERQVIECVLWANNGVVEATIEQLLQMSLDGQGTDDSSDSEDSIPPEILERTLEPDSSDEEPPPVYAPPSYDMHIYDRKYPADVPNTPPPRFDAHPPPGHQPGSGYRNWNPPLLGNLPDDFLRILPQQRDSLQRSHSSLSQPSSSSSSSLSSLSLPPVPSGGAAQADACGSGSGGGEQERVLGRRLEDEEDRRLRQYLEDERVALFLQNEEFMRELQRNRDFLIALERGDHSAAGSGEPLPTASDDALFRDKLKHMGKSTRKKLLEIARSFSEKTRRRKNKKKALLKHHSLGSAASTANLLEDAEGPAPEGDCQLKTPDTQEEETKQNKEVLS